MIVNKYFYEYSKEELADRVSISSIDRSSYMTSVYMDKFSKKLRKIKLTGRTAVLYAAGTTIALGESRNYSGDYSCSLNKEDSAIALKDSTGYMLHKYIGKLVSNGCDIVYANINSNTCASSMHSLYEAEDLLSNNRVDNVVIISEEKTSHNTLRVFAEMGISLKPSDGFACMVLSRGGKGIKITDTKWEYEYNRNPFGTTKDGYSKLLCDADSVKVHGTGTDNNTFAESIFKNQIEYKSKIGHAQGASGLLEVCMLIDDDNVHGDILCVASGLGGFYGGCKVHKPARRV